jgi:DNA-binding SARP family transcriptional activator/tetratricopeptide (TPR) repeat protein
MFQLECLGSPRLLTADGQPVRLRTKKHLGLLARVALEPGRLLTRDLLVDLFWSSAPPKQGRHSLVQAISVLRGKIGRDAVLATLTHVGIKAEVVAVDALDLTGSDTEVRGGFLEGFVIPDAPEFERWKDEWQARLLPRIRDCLVRQIGAARRFGDFRAVEHRARLLFEFDPLSEDAVRGLIEARVEAGDRGNAIRLFQQFEEKLAAELAAKPSPELARFVTQLRSAHGSGRVIAVREGDAANPPAPDQRGATRFVGRTEEYAVLFDAWERARTTKPSSATVLGDPGLGKTSLINRLAQTVSADGGLPLRTQAYESERFVPYAIFSDIARQLAACPAVAGTDPMWLGELTRICPEIREMYPGVPPCADLPAEVVPLRLAEAFVRTFTEVSAELPILLAVDDLHLADESSVGLLHVILRKLTSQRLLAVVAIRTTELASSVQAAALLRDAAAEGGARVTLDPLDGPAVEQIIAGVFEDHGVPVSPSAARRIRQNAGGNPLAAELLTVDWIQNHDEALTVLTDDVTAPAAGPERIPQAIREALYRQLDRLDAKTRGALDLASILGRRIGDLRSYHAIGLTVAEATAAQQTLLQSYLLREAAETLEFRNELLRLQVYYAVPVQARRHLHSLVADQLLKESATPTGQTASETAWHLWRADRIPEAIPFAIEGARDALRQGAPTQAERTLVAVRGQELTQQARVEAGLLLAEAYLMEGKPQPGLVLARECLDAPGLSPEQAADATRIVASAMYNGRLAGTAEFGAAADHAVQSAKTTGDVERICRALQVAAFSAEARRQEPMMAALLNEAAAIAETGAGRELGIAWTVRAFCQSWFDDTVNASKSLRRAVALLERNGTTADLAFAYNGLGLCASDNCRIEEAEAAFQSSLRLAREIGDDSRVAKVLSNLCFLRSRQGHFEEAVQLGTDAIEASDRAIVDTFHGTHLANLGCARWAAGDVDGARDVLRRADEWVAVQGSPEQRTAMDIEWADFFLATGSTEQALQRIGRLEESVAPAGRAAGYYSSYIRLLAVRAAFVKSPRAAFELLKPGIDRFQHRNPLAYLEVSLLQDWLARMSKGVPPPEPAPTFETFRAHGVAGSYLTLQMMGLAEPAGPTVSRSPAPGRQSWRASRSESRARLKPTF